MRVSELGVVPCGAGGVVLHLQGALPSRGVISRGLTSCRRAHVAASSAAVSPMGMEDVVTVA